MPFSYTKYPFSSILGWSISRYEVFDKCKRQYFYTYYGKYASAVPLYKINQLKELTSIPLEIGNVIHDVLEAFLKRLQKSDARIDEQRFFSYAHELAKSYFSGKTFLEIYYKYLPVIEMAKIIEKIDICLNNFIHSPVYSWIFMAALHDRHLWMIEPDGYGETRLDGLKVYCKMDFLLPVDDTIYILDWKTGKRDEHKHTMQLRGYSAAAAALFTIPSHKIFPRIVYLYPSFDEMEITVGDEEVQQLIALIHEQTETMYTFCSDVEKNTPREMDFFMQNPSPSLCRQCKYRELCFPDIQKYSELELIIGF